MNDYDVRDKVHDILVLTGGLFFIGVVLAIVILGVFGLINLIT